MEPNIVCGETRLEFFAVPNENVPKEQSKQNRASKFRKGE